MLDKDRVEESTDAINWLPADETFYFQPKRTIIIGELRLVHNPKDTQEKQ